MKLVPVRLLSLLALPILAFGIASSVQANLTVCNEKGANCGWTLSVTPVGGETVTTSGELDVSNGNIVLQGTPSLTSNGLTASVSGFSAAGDPSMGFGFSANNT